MLNIDVVIPEDGTTPSYSIKDEFGGTDVDLQITSKVEESDTGYWGEFNFEAVEPLKYSFVTYCLYAIQQGNYACANGIGSESNLASINESGRFSDTVSGAIVGENNRTYLTVEGGVENHEYRMSIIDGLLRYEEDANLLLRNYESDTEDEGDTSRFTKERIYSAYASLDVEIESKVVGNEASFRGAVDAIVNNYVSYDDYQESTESPYYSWLDAYHLDSMRLRLTGTVTDRESRSLLVDVHSSLAPKRTWSEATYKRDYIGTWWRLGEEGEQFSRYYFPQWGGCEDDNDVYCVYNHMRMDTTVGALLLPTHNGLPISYIFDTSILDANNARASLHVDYDNKNINVDLKSVEISRDTINKAASDSDGLGEVEPRESVRSLEIGNHRGVVATLTIDSSNAIGGTIRVGDTIVANIEETKFGQLIVRYEDGYFESLEF